MGLFAKLLVAVCVLAVIHSTRSKRNKKELKPDESLPRLLSLSQMSSIRDNSKYLQLYGPDPQINPICNYKTLMENEEAANYACMDECREISITVDYARAKYGDFSGVKLLYNQCHGFIDGTCRVVAFTSMTWCKCHGWYRSDKDGSMYDFYRPARVCLLMIPGARIQGKMAIDWEDYREWHKDYRRRLEEDREFGERIFAASPSRNYNSFLARIRSTISRQPSRSKSKRGNGSDSDS